MLNIPILYQDQDLAVVVKPSGLVVNNSDTIKEETLQDWWIEQLAKETSLVPGEWEKLVPADFVAEYGSPEQIFAERGGIVHRLDKETSGVMILAKNPGALVQLLAQFRNREVSKTYVCLVHGKFKITADTLSLPLGRSSINRTKFTVETEGRTAETRYEVQQFFPSLDVEKVVQNISSEERNLRKKLTKSYQGFSLVYCWPKTGRTHQIRVHMAHIKHPIVSDETYLGKKRSTLDDLWCPRLFLHARQLSFTHPRTQEKMEFEAELPAELNTVLGFLKEEA
jgi:23S rRNA pseudouridine1911/1915/1917 synthase